ncbi:MAG: hypothetical protein ACO3A2_04800 [Bdellovibrionia bacterium]
MASKIGFHVLVFFFLLSFFSTGGVNPSFAQSSIESQTLRQSSFDSPGNLKNPSDPQPDPKKALPVQARQFRVRVLKYAESKRLYLLKFDDADVPRPTQVLLIKNEASSIMGLRVIRSQPKDETVVAQIIQKYPGYDALQPEESYVAIVKQSDLEYESDLFEIPEAEFEDPSWRVSELAEEVLRLDPELDAGTTLETIAEKEAMDALYSERDERGRPRSISEILKQRKLAHLEKKLSEIESQMSTLETSSKNAEASQKNLEKTLETLEKKIPPPAPPQPPPPPETLNPPQNSNRTQEEFFDEGPLDSSKNESASIDEIKLLDRSAHWVSAGFGYTTNRMPTGGGYYSFAAGHFKYGLTVGRRVIFESARLQDSVALEAGGFIYKAINFGTAGDSYTLLSFLGALRYNIFFSESFGIYFYGGVLQANVIAQSSGVSSALVALNSILPAIGGGLLLQVGPGWFARFNGGFDDISLGLTLRF